MKPLTHALLLAFVLLTSCATAAPQDGAKADPPITAVRKNPDLALKNARVRYDEALDLLIFEVETKGVAGRTVPKAKGSMNGAPVLGYVFPTTLKPTDVGFSDTKGIVALAVTSHPDFDDTPLWDENADRRYDNDGVVWHPHWVILTKDARVKGGLAVKQFTDKRKVTLPPTNPGMPMFMDSPGFSVVQRGATLRVLVPRYRVGGKRTFNFDAVVAYMQVMKSDKLPMLGVYEVYDVLSGDLSLPKTVTRR